MTAILIIHRMLPLENSRFFWPNGRRISLESASHSSFGADSKPTTQMWHDSCLSIRPLGSIYCPKPFSREVNDMTWLAFGMGLVIGMFAGVLIISLCMMARARMPDIQDVEP